MSMILHVGCRCVLIIGCGFFLHDLERARRTAVQAGSQPVAIDVPDEGGLPLAVELQGSFGAGGRAAAASVAEFPIYLDDLPFHDAYPPDWTKSSETAGSVP
jgi:hypothetical protein